MDNIKAFILGVCEKVGGALNLPALTVAYIGLGLIVAIIIAVVVIIVCAVKKNKKKKAVANNVQPVEQSVTAEEVTTASVVEQPVVEEKPVEQVKEEPVAVEKVEEVKEEKKLAKKPVAKKAPAKKVEEKPIEEVKQPKKKVGKWTVEFKGHGEYLSKLLASNGEVMLSSEIYTTEEGARGGIATIIKGVDSGKFVIYQDKNKNYYYKLKTANNRLLCVGEIYKSKDQCLKAVESVKRIAKDSTILEEVYEGAQYIDYVPATVSTEIKKGTRGKWRVETTEDGAYSAKLYASNGQLMLATEEVALEKSAKNAINSVKKNAAEGNFIIDRDKFGRFYYKLRNVQKSVICIGEAYDTLESCTSAIESVRRFAATAVVPGEEE
ncbi:MAG: DUF1508 domain-containing protein [Clostridia bacterium]|nr:DUF1508 domain-containing protein [Clostridia bacterium]